MRLAELCLAILSAHPARAGAVAAALVVRRSHRRSDGRQPPADGGLRRPGVCSSSWRYQRWRVLVLRRPAGARRRRCCIAYNCAVLQHRRRRVRQLRAFSGRSWSGLAGLLHQPQPRPARLHADHGCSPCGARCGCGASTAPPWLRWLERRRCCCTSSCTPVQGMVGGVHVRPALLHRRAAGADHLPRLRAGAALPRGRRCGRWRRAGAVRRRRAGDRRLRRRRRWNRDPVPLEARPQRVWDWARSADRARSAQRLARLASSRRVMFDAFRDPVPAQIAPLTEAELASTIDRARSAQRRCGAARTATGVGADHQPRHRGVARLQRRRA